MTDGRIEIDYYGTQSTETIGVSDNTPANIELGEFSKISMIDITNPANLEGAYRLDEKAELALQSLVQDIISNWTIQGNRAEEVKTWLEDTGIIYSKNSKPSIIELLEDYYIYGYAAYQIVWKNNNIERLHRLCPLTTKIIRDPFSNDRIVIHDATIDGNIKKIGFMNLDRKDELLKLTAVQSEMVEVWLDIDDIIVMEGTSLMARCVNAIYQKQKLLCEVCDYINEHQAIPPIHGTVGEILKDGKAIGLPDGVNLTKEKYKEILQGYANDIVKLKYRGAVTTPPYVKFNAIEQKINHEYLKMMLDKYDEIIFNAFYSSEGLWKSGTADYRRKDMRRERLRLIRSMQAKIKELINELIRLNFGDVDVEFTFITDDTEELLEKSEYYKNIGTAIGALAQIGSSDESLKKIAQEFGIELDLALKTEQDEILKEQFADDSIDIISQNLVEKMMEKLETASIEVKDKVQKIIEKYKGNLNATAYNEIRKVVNESFKDIDFTKEIPAALQNTVTISALPLATDKGAIKFVENYMFDLCKKLTDNQKARLKNILVEELSTFDDTNLTQKIMHSLKVSRHEAERIARTELRRAKIQAEYEHYKNLQEKHKGKIDIYVKIISRGDGKVCSKCKQYAYPFVNKVWHINEYPQPLPLHPNCRCEPHYDIQYKGD